jgi:AcrR family transcriptional regulator
LESTIINHEARHRPGGRTARTTERINAAVLKVLVDEGVEACTLGRIAEIADLPRSTIYRRYADRWDMIIQAYMASAADEVVAEPTGDFLVDFRVLLTRFVDNFSKPIGQAMMTVVFAVRGTPAGEYLDRFMLTRLAQTEPIFAAAIAKGNIDPEINRREVIERAAGAALFRLYIEGLPVNEQWIDKMIDALRRLYSKPRAETGS